MIVELTVENLAIIERTQLRVGPGFTVLTGETGAGKSLLIDAIELALGERADTELVRTGASRASVHLVAEIEPGSLLAALCAEHGLVPEDGLLTIQRDVHAEGRSQARVNGKLTQVSTLRAIGKAMVDLHGQHDHQALLDPLGHGAFLDAWIGQPAKDALAETQRTWSALHALELEASRLRSSARDREHRLDLLKFQIEEIESAGAQPGEMDELEGQLSRLKYAERLAKDSFAALEHLSDKEGSAFDSLAAAIQQLEDASRFDASLTEVLEPLREAQVLMEEATRQVRSYSEDLEADPTRLDETTARIDTLKRLRRKYGDDEAAVLGHLESARVEFDSLSNAEENLASLTEGLTKARAKHLEACSILTGVRTAVAERFAEEVLTHLRDLAMDRAQFSVQIAPTDPSEVGADAIEFLFSANAGEAAKPLAKIASGGEISRVMLSLKAVLAGRAGVPTMIFDEVDAGLSGRAAATVARKIEELSMHYQVMAISHLPQIASRATTHYRIEKVDLDGRTVTQVRALNTDERIAEIARLLAGDHVTDAALANARELLGLS